MKNVILIDFGMHTYKSLLTIKNANISVILFPDSVSEKEIEYVKTKSPKTTIIKLSDVLTQNKYFINENEIRKNYLVQLKAERFFSRVTNNASFIQDNYYRALSFWIFIFKNYMVDVLLCPRSDHGGHMDTIAMHIASSLDIASFHIDMVLRNDNADVLSVRCYNNFQYINLLKLDHAVEDFNLNEILFYKKLFKLNKNKTNKNLIKNIKQSFFNLIKKNPKKREFIGITYYLDYFEQIKSHFYMQKLKKFYNKLSTKHIDKTNKSILWALHFEPEASIMNKTIYNSQIYNIRMLSAALPEGWKIYVKEHPHQFELFNTERMYFLKNIQQYRDELFYEQILSIPNVELLDINIKSSDLLKDSSIKAMATINGTIALECMFFKKPVFMFDASSVVYGLIDDVFKVTSFDDLVKSFDKLSDDNFKVEYKDFEKKLKPYMFHTTERFVSGWKIPDKILTELVKQSEILAKKK